MRMKSLIASNMLGSVGGLTFMNNPFHQIVVRQRTVPVQPNTTNQMFVKTAFASAVSAWEQATDQQRSDWAAYAQTVTFQGPLGPYSPTGRNLAIAQFQIIQYIEAVSSTAFVAPADMDAPVTGGSMALSNIIIGPPDAVATGFKINIANNNGEDITVYGVRSLKHSGARNFFKGPYVTDTIEVVGITDASNGDIEFVGLVADGVYFVRLRGISTGTPRRYTNTSFLRAVAITNP